MRNGKKHKMMPLLLPFTTCVVTFALLDEMADVSIVGLQWLILIRRLNNKGSKRPRDYRSKPYLHQEKKYKIWNKNHQPAAIWIYITYDFSSGISGTFMGRLLLIGL